MSKLLKHQTATTVLETMTSLEIAALTGKGHRNVLADCRVLAEFYAETYCAEKSAQWITGTKYKDSTGRSLPCFALSKQASLDLVTGYSLAHRHAVNKRWQELETKLAELQRSEQERIRARQRARLECPELTDAIKRSREAQDKKVMFFHYSNEFDMINRIALGQTAKQFRAHHQLGKDALMRDHLSIEQIKAIEHLQRVNTALVDAGLSAEQRKGALEVICKRDHEHLMIAELIQQESM